MRLISPTTRLAILLPLAVACKSLPEWQPDRLVAPTPSQAWIPETDHDEPWFASPTPADTSALEGATVFDLARWLDIALRNNPMSRRTWEAARAAAAGYGVARAELYPNVEVGGDAQVANADNPFDYVQVNNDHATWLVQGKLTLRYLLTDFGGRRARISAARQALYLANWIQNQVLQDVIRDVAKAFYQHQGAEAEVRAYEVSLETAETTTDAAQARLDVGVGTISDVLQAKADEARVQVDLAGSRGDAQIALGELATAVGWPANARLSVEPAAEELPFEDLAQDADQLIDLAYDSRPLLAAALALVRSREQVLRQAKARRRPELSTGAAASEQMLRGQNVDQGFIYEVRFNLTIPIFTGGALRSGVREAEAQLEEAKAALTEAEQAVSSGVWSAYYGFRTAVDQVAANQVLLVSSEEAYEVALERFRNGIGDIVELLNAQSLLAGARADLVRSRTNALTSYAELVHAVGSEVATASGRGGSASD